MAPGKEPAIAREPLPLGFWANIKVGRSTVGTWSTRVKYRDMEGKVRIAEARGTSAASAHRNPQQKLADRKTPQYGLLNPRS